MRIVRLFDCSDCSIERLKNMKKIGLLSLVAGLVSLTASAAHIKETLSLAKGWNGVYLESTPEVATCSDFFKDMPAVRKALVYDGRGLEGTPLIDENGRDVLQPPVYYYTWNADFPGVATLKSLVGGRCYLIYTTNDCTKTFTGVPHPPYTYWRKTDDTDSQMNFVGVSRNPNRAVSAKAYFGEGPYDGGKAYMVGGEDKSKPTMKPLFNSAQTVGNALAYSVSASRSGLWPGVISVGSDQLLIMDGSGALKVSNAGTTARTIRMKMVKSENKDEAFPPLTYAPPRTSFEEDPAYEIVGEDEYWDVELPVNGAVELVFKTVPAEMEKGKTYAAVLEIEDLGASAMRVRLPVWVLDEKDTSLEGLWVGAIALDKVSSIDGKKEPLPAAGVMSLNVIMHVSTNRVASLMQRAIVATDEDGNTVVCRDNENFPYPWTIVYRMFTGMMSVDVPSVREIGGPNFGTAKDLVFAWTVPERARDNPFRHAWHPDHDGRTADYSAAAPTGDDLSNYGGIIKPELWSVTNTLSFKLDKEYKLNADESMEGKVVWDVDGLVSTNTIRSTGSFHIRRIVKDVELEK